MEARERILTKAHELFNRLGIRSVTMDDIALKTGMSKKTIYQSFANKDELVEAVLKDHLSKNFEVCESNRLKAENAIHEIFLNIDTVQELIGEMNPQILNELEKFHHAAFMHLYHHKNNYMYKVIKANLEWGIKDGLYREDISTDVLTKLRIETMFIPFNQEIYPHNKYNLVNVERQTLEHFIYGVATIKGYKLIDKYKQQRIKPTKNE